MDWIAGLPGGAERGGSCEVAGARGAGGMVGAGAALAGCETLATASAAREGRLGGGAEKEGAD